MTAGWFDGEVSFQPVTGWWVERHESFTLTVEPMIGLSAGFRAAAPLVVTPELGMVGAGTSRASVGLSVVPQFGMGAPHPTSIGLELAPQLGMAGGERYPATMGLTVTPRLDMVGEQVFKQAIHLDVEPQIGMAAAGTSKAAFGLEVSPEFGAAAVGTSRAAFDLTVTPTLNVTGTALYTRDLDLTITPTMGMSVGERYKRATTLTITPSVGMTGEGIEPPPEVLFNAVGVGGSGSGSFSWSHTASGDGRAVVVSLAAAVAFSTISDITVTYGGITMAPLTARGFNNAAIATNRTQQFILLNPPTGPQTVQVTVVAGGLPAAAANSVSYNHVGSYTQGASGHGSGTSRSLTVTTASAGDMVAQAFGDGGGSTMSSYNQALRSSLAPGGVVPALLIGDSDEGDDSITFTATGGSATWSGVSVVLHPA